MKEVTTETTTTAPAGRPLEHVVTEAPPAGAPKREEKETTRTETHTDHVPARDVKVEEKTTRKE